MTMTDLCAELRNWFDRDMPAWKGTFEVSDGAFVMQDGMSLLNGQYYRIIGSVFNDGVHKYPDDELADESFAGTIRAMAVPPAVIALAAEINAWETDYGAVAKSPYASESFGGYSYSKAQKSGASGVGGAFSWQDVFASKLNRWRKI